MRAARMIIVPLVTTTLPLRTTTWLSKSILPGRSDSVFSGLKRSAFSARAGRFATASAARARRMARRRRRRGTRDSGKRAFRIAAQNLQIILCEALRDALEGALESHESGKLGLGWPPPRAPTRRPRSGALTDPGDQRVND